MKRTLKILHKFKSLSHTYSNFPLSFSRIFQPQYFCPYLFYTIVILFLFFLSFLFISLVFIIINLPFFLPFFSYVFFVRSFFSSIVLLFLFHLPLIINYSSCSSPHFYSPSRPPSSHADSLQVSVCWYDVGGSDIAFFQIRSEYFTRKEHVMAYKTKKVLPFYVQ
jgi:hypothetical protein